MTTLHRALRKRSLLLATSSLLAIGVALTSVLFATPAFADGGTGGSGFGWSPRPGGAGFDGTDGVTSFGGAGGGGGGAGGGAGGAGLANAGGAGGTAVDLDGQNGGPATESSVTTNGGGGGGGGYNGNGAGSSAIQNTGTMRGGNGGAGGSVDISAPHFSGGSGGGGGGAGGYGAVAVGNGVSTNSDTGSISGGNGGNGGSSGRYSTDQGGGGGDGGVGVQFTTSGATLINHGTIIGGKGGLGGAGASPSGAGSAGAGGAGIVGSSLTVINSGSITGGLAGDGATRANAITFTGGSNVYELQNGGGVTGNVVDQTGNGTFRLGGTADGGSFDASSLSSITGGTETYQGFAHFEKTGTSVWTLTGTTTFTGDVNLNAGTLVVGTDTALGTGTLTVGGASTLSANTSVTLANAIVLNAELGIGGSGDLTLTGGIDGIGALTMDGTGKLTLTGTNFFTGGTAINSGIMSVSSGASIGNPGGVLTIDGGTLQVTGTTFHFLTQSLNWGSRGGGFDIADPTNIFTVSDVLGGTGGLTKSGAGMLVLSGANTYTGGTMIAGGTLQAGAANVFASGSAHDVAAGATLDLAGFDQSIGSLAGAGNVFLGSATLTAGGDNTSTDFSGVISGSGGFTKNGTGRLNLTGTSTYTGATTVDGGTLSVNGDISSSSGVTVNASGTLGGNGIVGNTAINGGTLAPGNSIGLLTVNGNLSFTAASSYMVEVSPSNADRVNVTGTATLNGATVHVSYAPGSYLTKQYTILTAGNMLTDTFSGPVSNNLPSIIQQSLSYDQNNVYLNTQISFAVPGGLNANQQRVGNALTSFFNTTGGIPVSFASLSPNGLTQASGELGTTAQQTTYQATNMFMGLISDPFSAGRGDASGTSSETGFADESESMAYAGRAKSKNPSDAFAAFTKAPPAVFAQRWNVWAAGFGGSQTTDGNAGFGSNNTTSSVYGAVAGADYWFSPDTVAGFALAGGGSNFSVANGGSGRSDLFQAGAFVRHNFDATYVTASVAYGWQDVTTDRYVSVAGVDHLRAEFNTNSYSGRLELGHRFLTPWFGGLGVSPYAAAQITAFELPSYAERAISGASTFALNYGGDTTTSSRTELGLRTDKSYALDGAVLTLRGRAAWAHDFNPNSAVAATFQTLPGASFVVNGAALASDSALTTASAEVRWLNGWSVAATFEGEFSDVTRSYAGKGVVRYAW